MRILAASNAMTIEDLSLTERNLKVLKKAISKPYGIVLCVGPTGSGKTTTLHSALGNINTSERKIWTAEDPVEISQQGLRQGECKPKIGLDFARGMLAYYTSGGQSVITGHIFPKTNNKSPGGS